MRDTYHGSFVSAGWPQALPSKGGKKYSLTKMHKNAASFLREKRTSTPTVKVIPHSAASAKERAARLKARAPVPVRRSFYTAWPRPKF